MNESKVPEGLRLIEASALSATNPEATKEQRDLEALAIRLYETPEVQKAKHEAAVYWLDKPDRLSPEALSSFDDAINDFAFHCALEAANSDTNYPKVLRVECEPHTWFGMQVPGSRRGGNNADLAYRIIPVDGNGHFEITGKRAKAYPPDVNFTLIGNTTMSKTLGNLELRDIEIDQDGVFSFTVSPEPADGRANHLQSTVEAKYVFMRDAMTDWSTQRVNAMSVRRLEDITAVPIEFDELVRRTAQFVRDDTAYYSVTIDITARPPLNDFAVPFNPGQYGGLISQRGTFGRFNLRDEQAIVVTMTTCDAVYLSMTVHDPWWRTIPFARHTSTLNNAQAIADAQGSYTFVISPTDPGVHNWIDTAGLHEGIMYMRWQGMPKDTPYDGGPEILQSKVVDLAELRSVLAEGTKFVSTMEREQQIAARALAVAGRWLDH